MPLARRKHFAVDALSEEGQAAVRAGFEAGQTLEAIAAALQAATGEIVSINALSNWHRWERTKARFAELEQEHSAAVQLVRAIPDSRIVHALSNALEHYLVSKEGEFEKESAVDLLGHFHAMQKLGLAHEKVRLAEQSLKVEKVRAVAAEKQAEAALTAADAAMRRVELLAKQAVAVAQAAEEASGQAKDGHVPVEALNRVLQEVYGLRAAVAAEVQHG